MNHTKNCTLVGIHFSFILIFCLISPPFNPPLHAWLLDSCFYLRFDFLAKVVYQETIQNQSERIDFDNEPVIQTIIRNSNILILF